MIKKALFVGSFIFLLSNSIAQSIHQQYNASFDWRYAMHNGQLGFPDDFKKVEGAKSITLIWKEKEKTSTQTKEYDRFGNLTKLSRKGHDGIERKQMECTFGPGEGWLLTATHYDHKGKLISKSKFERNEAGQPTLMETWDKKGKPLTKKTWTYADNERLLSSAYYKKGREIPELVWEYEYFEDYKTKSVLKNGEGEVLNTWVFDCDEKGRKLEKKEKTVQHCTWSETDNDHLIKVYQTFDSKGKIRKNIQTFTLKDTLPIKYESFDAKERPVNVVYYDHSFDKVLSSDFILKGKLRTSYRYLYKDNELLAKEWYSRGKLYSRTEYVYQKDLIVETKTFNKKRKLVRSRSVEVELYSER